MSNDKRDREDRPIWLTSLAEADREAVPSGSSETRLQGALRRRRHTILAKRTGALAIVVMLGSAIWQTSTMRSVVEIELVDENVADAISEAMNMAGDEDADFVPTQFASEQPLEAVRVVRVSMPRGALAKYGVSVADSSNGGEVTADLLVGQDGIARAIRVVK